jgi:hypothetical protein
MFSNLYESKNKTNINNNYQISEKIDQLLANANTTEKTILDNISNNNQILFEKLDNILWTILKFGDNFSFVSKFQNEFIRINNLLKDMSKNVFSVKPKISSKILSNSANNETDNLINQKIDEVNDSILKNECQNNCEIQ